MMARMAVSLGVFASTLFAEPKVVVELVPDNPGPYEGGESLTVDVWLHSQVSFDLYIWLVRLDLSDSNPALIVDPTFTFDLSSSETPNDFEVHPELPIPWAANWLEYACDPCRLQLPAGGSLHMGSVGVTLPIETRTYRLDALNADDPNADHGALMSDDGSFYWRAFTGDITGGVYEFPVTPEIPALSWWGMVVLGLVLVGAGSALIVRRAQAAKNSPPGRAPGGARGPTPNSRFLGVCTAGLFLAGGDSLLAEPPLVAVDTAHVRVDSGAVSATGEDNKPIVVFQKFVELEGVQSIRLHFGRRRGSGAPPVDHRSFLRISRLEKAAVQVLDAAGLIRSGNSSPYFNGDRLRMHLLADPGTVPAAVAGGTIAGPVPQDAEWAGSICGDDDRVPSNDPRVGRLRFVRAGTQCTTETWCTAFLFDDRPNGLLTAGHCCDRADFGCGFSSCGVQGEFPAIVEFNVPLSEPDGTLVCAASEDQYPVDAESVDFQYTGMGNDWCYFGVFDNATTGLSPLEAQVASYRLAQTVPTDWSCGRATGPRKGR